MLLRLHPRLRPHHHWSLGRHSGGRRRDPRRRIGGIPGSTPLGGEPRRCRSQSRGVTAVPLLQPTTSCFLAVHPCSVPSLHHLPQAHQVGDREGGRPATAPPCGSSLVALFLKPSAGTRAADPRQRAHSGPDPPVAWCRSSSWEVLYKFYSRAVAVGPVITSGPMQYVPQVSVLLWSSADVRAVVPTSAARYGRDSYGREKCSRIEQCPGITLYNPFHVYCTIAWQAFDPSGMHFNFLHPPFYFCVRGYSLGMIFILGVMDIAALSTSLQRHRKATGSSIE